jgi:putative redox protein
MGSKGSVKNQRQEEISSSNTGFFEMVRKAIKVEFQGHRGLLLRGVHHVPQSSPKGGVILCHCFTCSKDFKIINWLSKELSSLGFSTLRFDFAGLNTSDGNFEETNLSTNIEDLFHAVEWLGDQGIPVRALIGHSMGGTAAVLTASQLPGIESVVVLGTSSETTALKRLLSADHMAQLESQGRTDLRIGGKTVTLNRAFFEDLYHHSLLETVAKWNKALLIFHGTRDQVVPIQSGERIFQNAVHPKAFTAVADAGHLFAENREKAIEMAKTIASWIEMNRM